MKHILLFLACLLIGCMGMFLYVRLTASQQSATYAPILSHISQSHPTTAFSLDNPPKDALIGQIATMEGSVEFTSRTATQPAQLNGPTQIEQGESLQTDTLGSATVQFPSCCKIRLSPQTQLGFVQTLPANVVVNQLSGTGEYIVTHTVPVAIRSLDLLVNISAGDVVCSVSKTEPVLDVFVKTGSMEASFNDLQYNSTVIPVQAGQTFYFNDTTREESVE